MCVPLGTIMWGHSQEDFLNYMRKSRFGSMCPRRSAALAQVGGLQRTKKKAHQPVVFHQTNCTPYQSPVCRDEGGKVILWDGWGAFWLP